MKRYVHLRREVCLSLSLVSALVICGFGVAEASGHEFEGQGPHRVSSSTIAGQGFLFAPSGGSSATKKWPAVVFAHGLCGPAARYSESLERVASWGFIVLANEKQEDCGALDINRPVESMENLFLAPFKFGNAVNFSAMAKNVESNLDYLQTRGDVDPNAIALMGHSMGAGIVVDVAARLAKSHPNRVKAVVSIAPWNGVEPTPSSVVHEMNTPLLIFCSMSDTLCPCSGPATITDTQGLVTGPASLGIPVLFGPGEDSTWHGGAMAIFQHARNATLIDVKAVSHFTIAGAGSGAQMQKLADWAKETSGLNFSKPKRPYTQIPTLGYAVAFLNEALNLSRSKGEQVMREARSDPRLVRVETSK
jgi:dienelactone hydrolase